MEPVQDKLDDRLNSLLAQYGNEICEAAQKKDVMVQFEAAVGGGIPILNTLREELAGNRIEEIYGIVNGTTNFILSKMTEHGEEFGADSRFHGHHLDVLIREDNTHSTGIIVESQVDDFLLCSLTFFRNTRGHLALLVKQNVTRFVVD